jgi:hypothetical protein
VISHPKLTGKLTIPIDDINDIEKRLAEDARGEAKAYRDPQRALKGFMWLARYPYALDVPDSIYVRLLWGLTVPEKYRTMF